jgi:hypothetical protein
MTLSNPQRSRRIGGDIRIFAAGNGSVKVGSMVAGT